LVLISSLSSHVSPAIIRLIFPDAPVAGALLRNDSFDSLHGMIGIHCTLNIICTLVVFSFSYRVGSMPGVYRVRSLMYAAGLIIALVTLTTQDTR